ncbi:sulfur carrier protein ThiS [Paradesertivirga mongoliensis]|uniref:Sulfur carrier protein ThiS n=1 Tax=Paradesertivirga mongoliensis TaxID=2100740 RepID=A0ABW4ZRZ8_9SPHI|nr:sulfur carrier protein ThiS [Pedobacter mongoliensis]
MEVFINNQSVSVRDAVRLSEILLQQNFLDKKGIAVAVNNSVIPKTDWENFRVESADKITIIRATQGG